MRRNLRLAVWSGGAVASLAILFVLTSHRPPRLPADRSHTYSQTESHCLTCHAFAAEHPRPADHPPRDDCFSCHRDAQGVLHPRPGAATSLPGGWRDDPRLRE